MDTARRQFMKLSAAAISALASGATLAASGAQDLSISPNAWHQRIKRIMQLNFTERDAADFNVSEWIDYLVELKTECTFISVTNLVAFYPTGLSELPVSRWLNGRDILGECTRAAKQKNIRVLGRLSIDVARAELADKNPEWFRRQKDGSMGFEGVSSKASEISPSFTNEYAPVCSFTPYFDDFVPKLIDEVMTRYDLDGIYTNGWPLSSYQVCYCNTCQKIGDPKSERYRIAYQKRIFDLVANYNARVAKRNRDAIYVASFGNAAMGGNLDVSDLTKQSVWMFADNQGRHDSDAPSWDATQQARISGALAKNRPVIASTGAWFYNGASWWRTSAGNAAEVRSRLFQTLAAGGTMHLHWLGTHQGFRDDRRWQAYGRDIFPWQAANDRHFHNRASLANVALVVSPTSNRLYKSAPGTANPESFQGAYKLLTEGRIPFDIVLTSDLGTTSLAPYDVLILPNVALLSHEQARQIKAFVQRGGSLLTTYETGLYDETGAERKDYALADLFGMRKAGGRIGYGYTGPNGAVHPGFPFMQRIEAPGHPILSAFRGTDVIKGGSWRVPTEAAGEPLLTLLPQYPIYPVEAVFPKIDRTTTPMIVAREIGKARMVHLVGDNEAAYWRSAATDLGDLFLQSVRWLMGDRRPMTVEGDGLLEVLGWRTEPGYALHLVNHTNPNFRGGAFRDVYSVGAQTVSMELQDERPVRTASLLRAGLPLPFRQRGRVVEFTVPSVAEYEVVALET